MFIDLHRLTTKQFPAFESFEPLTDLEARLDPRRFVRIDRATIVNAAFVHELYPGVDGVIVRLKDDKATELSVARDRCEGAPGAARNLNLV